MIGWRKDAVNSVLCPPISIPITPDHGAFKHRRCIVPAKEWYQTSAGRHEGARFGLLRSDDEPMAWAGLWESYTQADGEIVRTYCVITVATGPDVEPYHHRQPLVLEKPDLAVWMGARDGDVLALIVASPRGSIHPRMLAHRG